jgi:hypothetical protein
MEAAMPASWSIKAEWEPLDSGPPEERACFAALGIQAHGFWLTEGSDVLANRLRHAPLLSAYHLAEWMAWNWWRLRWEPRSKAKDWGCAHRLATIGYGYIWPNLTIFSDGERSALIARPTEEREQTPFRYITDRAVVIPASEFETELDLFIDQVLDRLDWAKVTNSNLATIWGGIREERRTPALTQARKLEALLGQDPDESDPKILEQLSIDAKQLSISAIEELAAEHGQTNRILTAKELREIAESSGFDASPRNIVRLPALLELPRGGQIPAHKLGARAAEALRERERLGDDPISDERLTEIAGAQHAVLTDRRGAPGISFALDENLDRTRIVLRSKWRTGRRFELARLLGDRIARPPGGRLFPATRAYTYRQKMQRSFAAELLSPFEAVDHMLEGDYSVEHQQDIAEHFDVSTLTIRTLLVNHGRVEREELDGEFEAAVA